MDKEKQIEEMAKIQCDSCRKYTGESEDCNSVECLSLRKKYANEIYNAGYRKIEEGSVVLSKEDYEDLKYKESLLSKTALITKEELLMLHDNYNQARKKALDLTFILSEVIEKLNVCTLKLENKSQEFTDGYTEAIAEVRGNLKELIKNVGIAIKE